MKAQKVPWKVLSGGDDISESGDISSVYNAHYEILLNYGMQFNLDKASVQDCIHDLFVDLWKSGKSMNELTSIKAYLLKALKNKVYKKLKKNKINIEIDEHSLQDHIFPIQISIEQSLVGAEHQREMEAALNKEIQNLSPRQRELIYHIFYNGFSYEEASQILNITKKTAYNLVLKAVNNLRKKIDPSQLYVFIMFPLVIS